MFDSGNVDPELLSIFALEINMPFQSQNTGPAMEY